MNFMFNCWDAQNERFLPTLLSFGLFWSQLKNFCCDLKRGHDRGFMLQHINFLSFLYFSLDLSFIILTFFFTLYFSHPALLVATFGLMLRPKHKHSNSRQFQFILFQSKQLQLNSSSSCKNSTTHPLCII